MTNLEAVLYALLYAYVFLGAGYFLRRLKETFSQLATEHLMNVCG